MFPGMKLQALSAAAQKDEPFSWKLVTLAFVEYKTACKVT